MAKRAESSAALVDNDNEVTTCSTNIQTAGKDKPVKNKKRQEGRLLGLLERIKKNKPESKTKTNSSEVSSLRCFKRLYLIGPFKQWWRTKVHRS